VAIADAFDADPHRRITRRSGARAVIVRQALDAGVRRRVALGCRSRAVPIRSARTGWHALAGHAQVVAGGALATSADGISTWVAEDCRFVVANKVGVSATLMARQIDVQVAILTVRCALRTVVDAGSGRMLHTGRKSPGNCDRCASEHPLQDAPTVNPNCEVFNKPIEATAVHATRPSRVHGPPSFPPSTS